MEGHPIFVFLVFFFFFQISRRHLFIYFGFLVWGLGGDGGRGKKAGCFLLWPEFVSQ